MLKIKRNKRKKGNPNLKKKSKLNNVIDKKESYNSKKGKIKIIREKIFLTIDK